MTEKEIRASRLWVKAGTLHPLRRATINGAGCCWSRSRSALDGWTEGDSTFHRNERLPSLIKTSKISDDRCQPIIVALTMSLGLFMRIDYGVAFGSFAPVDPFSSGKAMLAVWIERRIGFEMMYWDWTISVISISFGSSDNWKSSNRIPCLMYWTFISIREQCTVVHFVSFGRYDNFDAILWK